MNEDVFISSYRFFSADSATCRSNWTKFRQSFKRAMTFRSKTTPQRRDVETARSSSEERTPLRMRRRQGEATSDRKRHESDPAKHSGDAIERVPTDIDNNEKKQNFRLPLVHRQLVPQLPASCVTHSSSRNAHGSDSCVSCCSGDDRGLEVRRSPEGGRANSRKASSLECLSPSLNDDDPLRRGEL